MHLIGATTVLVDSMQWDTLAETMGAHGGLSVMLEMMHDHAQALVGSLQALRPAVGSTVAE